MTEVKKKKKSGPSGKKRKKTPFNMGPKFPTKGQPASHPIPPPALPNPQLLAVRARTRTFPKTVAKNFPPDWQDILIEHYAEGGTDVEARVLFRKKGFPIPIRTWYRMLQEEPEFNEFMQEMRALGEAFWVKRLRDFTSYIQGQGNEKPEASLLKFYMTNVYNWSDTMRVQGVPMTESKDALLAEARRLGIPIDGLFEERPGGS